MWNCPYDWIGKTQVLHWPQTQVPACLDCLWPSESHVFEPPAPNLSKWVHIVPDPENFYKDYWDNIDNPPGMVTDPQ